MEKRGMKGKFNGNGPNGKPKHYKFRTSYITREIQKKELNVESPQQHIQIMDCAEDELYNDCHFDVKAIVNSVHNILEKSLVSQVG